MRCEEEKYDIYKSGNKLTLSRILDNLGCLLLSLEQGLDLARHEMMMVEVVEKRSDCGAAAVAGLIQTVERGRLLCQTQ
jgi:hypothetical protein